VASEIVDHCIECGFCESNCPSRDVTLTPRQRIACYKEMARLKQLPGPTASEQQRCAVARQNSCVARDKLEGDFNSEIVRPSAGRQLIAARNSRVTFGSHAAQGLHPQANTLFLLTPS